MLTKKDIETYNKIQAEIDACVIAEFGEKRGIYLSPESLLDYAKQYRERLITSKEYLHKRYDIITQNILPSMIENLNNSDIFKDFILKDSLSADVRFCKMVGEKKEYLNMLPGMVKDGVFNFVFEKTDFNDWECYFGSRLKTSIKKHPDNQIAFIQKNIRDTNDLRICDILRSKDSSVICFH